MVLDLKKAGAFTDYFVICSASNPRQVQAIADAVEEALKAQKQRPSLVEGYARAEWILLDYFDFVIHVFSKHARDFYGLDRLWGSATRTNFPTSRNGPGAWAWAWARLHQSLLSTLFEPPCAACRKPLLHPLNGAVCDDCWTSLRLAPRLLDQLRADHGVDWACAVDRYEGRMKEIIHALKYERRRSIAPPLGELMRNDGRAIC